MAIYSAVPPPPELGGAPTAAAANATHDAAHQQQPPQQTQSSGHSQTGQGVDIEAWTISALQSLSVSPAATGTTGAPLSIPLDNNEKTHGDKPSVTIDARALRSKGMTPPPRPPSRRDSQRRREALLKGKEGSRQRRRWENDRLMHVPNAQPPEPSDWAPQPTHPVVHVPYQVAGFWDLRVRAEVEGKQTVQARRKQHQTRTLGDEAVGDGRVPRELCSRAKKIPAVKGWVRILEEPVRKYLIRQREMAEGGSAASSSSLSSDGEGDGDTEDEEIVFVGRSGMTMRDGWKKATARKAEAAAATEQEEGLVFDALGGAGQDDDDEKTAFKRWITHSISDYYGLESRSVLVGNPKRKVVYVGMKKVAAATTTAKSLVPPPRTQHLPRPLWELC